MATKTLKESKFEYLPITQVGYWQGKLMNIDSEFWVDKLYDLKKEYDNNYKSNIGGYQSPNLINDANLLDLKFFIVNSIKDLTKSENIDLFEIWLNISSFGNFNLPHNHIKENKGINYSGVLYLKTNEKSGDIRFYNPFNFNESYPYTPQIKDIVLFDSNVYHSVDVNLSKEDRMSIAFNFRIEK